MAADFVDCVRGEAGALVAAAVALAGVAGALGCWAVAGLDGLTPAVVALVLIGASESRAPPDEEFGT